MSRENVSVASNQKLKILYLMEILLEETDEMHPMTMNEILETLEQRGISAERKSIYSDIDALREFGLDIKLVRSQPAGYFVASRSFELPELKLLVDSVQSSQFITEKKTMSLIQKLEKLCSKHEARAMRRQIYVVNRIKNMNESIYYYVDMLHTAIAQDVMIRFQYFEYNVDKRRIFRKGGAYYSVSPFALTWDSENYYLIAFDKEAQIFKHYRVDKMHELSVEKREREGKEAFKQLDMAIYTRRTFSMFGGERMRVQLQFENSYAGVVIDRFGKDVIFDRINLEQFTINVPVVVSPQFFGWVLGLGDKAKIIGPESVTQQMQAYLKEILSCYS